MMPGEFQNHARPPHYNEAVCHLTHIEAVQNSTHAQVSQTREQSLEHLWTNCGRSYFHQFKFNFCGRCEIGPFERFSFKHSFGGRSLCGLGDMSQPFRFCIGSFDQLKDGGHRVSFSTFGSVERLRGLGKVGSKKNCRMGVVSVGPRVARLFSERLPAVPSRLAQASIHLPSKAIVARTFEQAGGQVLDATQPDRRRPSRARGSADSLPAHPPHPQHEQHARHGQRGHEVRAAGEGIDGLHLFVTAFRGERSCVQYRPGKPHKPLKASVQMDGLPTKRSKTCSQILRKRFGQRTPRRILRITPPAKFDPLNAISKAVARGPVTRSQPSSRRSCAGITCGISRS